MLKKNQVTCQDSLKTEEAPTRQLFGKCEETTGRQAGLPTSTAQTSADSVFLSTGVPMQSYINQTVSMFIKLDNFVRFDFCSLNISKLNTCIIFSGILNQYYEVEDLQNQTVQVSCTRAKTLGAWETIFVWCVANTYPVHSSNVNVY